MAGGGSFPIVGIGASAGGVQALEKLFRRIPADTGMAFVVVTHLARGHESLLPEILIRDTPMPVTWASHMAAIEPNHVYLAPADSILTIENGKLALLPRPSDNQATKIDVFLSALAGAKGEAAIGILLSGSGSDGSLGLKAIKERGGLTLAQGTNGSGPLHAEMPNAAIVAGVVDIVAPVEEIAARIMAYAQLSGRGDPEDETESERDDDGDDGIAQAYNAIHRILHKQHDNDFSGYKQKTFQRRVRRRMDVHQLLSLDAYVARLREDPAEVSNLFRDLLIGVTGFFRDPDAFEALAREVIPRIFERQGASGTVRIWIPASSTGEEVYSIVILLREHIDTLKAPPAIQVFATDIDETALAISRTGRYPAQLLDGVSSGRLGRFFVRDGGGYTVVKELRDICVFSLHSVIRDPPFSRLDLISCRNLLIYLGQEFQSRVFPIFHFALKPQGYLFLGSSESIGKHADLFAPVDKKQRVFQRREHAVSPLQLAPFGGDRTPGRGIAELQREFGPAATTLRRTVEARLTERFAPAHVVVNRDGDIVHYSTRTGKYLEPPAGAPSRQLITMARKGLRLELRAALHEALETQRTAERKNIAIEIEDRTQVIDLVIDPIVDPKNETLFLVLFRDVGLPAVPSSELHAGSDGDARFEQVEQEVREVRERLQATIEEYETGVEELKSSNEELQTVNEELQSSNEELETAKEELQSLNEEMHTVNAELTVKIEELDQANSDLRNIFASTQIAVVFLDANLVIRTFTPAATEIFNLISTDRGRPLSDIASNLADADLHRDIRRVFEGGEIVERNVRTSKGSRQYLMRILPYRTRKNLIEGILMTFVDITVIAKTAR